ncbi:MAG: Hsp70 family protein [Chitinivibrionales bacterium]
MPAQFAIGIDLGTTNSVVAYTSLESEEPQVKLLQVSQVVAPSTIEQRSGLPSFCYLTTPGEEQSGVFAQEWQKDKGYCVGEGARRQSADVPTRTISAAKSWLANTRVDRHTAILPWDAPEDVEKISPVEASRRYLLHLSTAWEQRHPDAPLNQQKIVLTVPASFDASARELTHQAALEAGLPQDLVLLEEPQAAVYAWLNDVGDEWRKQLKIGDTILVCDVGGGTTDFSLIGVSEENGDLILRRIAVGNHILVGGDNMDLTLAHVAQQAFNQKGTQLDAWQAVSLWHACRNAKEDLLGENPPQSKPVTILGRGSRLIGSTITADLQRTHVTEALLEGFFPACDRDERPKSRPVSGFRQIGLPFESDTAVTRHLAQFLSAHASDPDKSVRPTHILFNGGVFKSDIFRHRIVDVISAWFSEENAPDVLVRSPDFDNAVARGAATYGFIKERKGIRIRGGTARSYYVGIETAGPAVPGFARPLSALCVVPFGMEEGSEIEVPGDEIGLVVGEPAVFRFFSSSVRKDDKPGMVLSGWGEEQLQETDSLEAHLPAEERFEEGYVPVKFHPRITELGMFELWCKSTISDDSWKLEFNIREQK